MSLHNRLRHLEAHAPRGGCPTCARWDIRVEIPDEVSSTYELQERQRRLEREGPGPREWPPECPDCGRHIDTVTIVHVDDWHARRRP